MKWTIHCYDTTDWATDSRRSFLFALAGFFGGSAFIYSVISPGRITVSRLKSMMGLEGGSHGLERRKLTSREQRFIKFSSVEHVGQVYMTPQDFLESVIEAEPKPRLKRRSLSERDLATLAEITPGMRGSSENLFRTLGNKEQESIMQIRNMSLCVFLVVPPFQIPNRDHH